MLTWEPSSMNDTSVRMRERVEEDYDEERSSMNGTLVEVRHGGSGHP